jgi:hypothetical protein
MKSTSDTTTTTRFTLSERPKKKPFSKKPQGYFELHPPCYGEIAMRRQPPPEEPDHAHAHATDKNPFLPYSNEKHADADHEHDHDNARDDDNSDASSFTSVFRKGMAAASHDLQPLKRALSQSGRKRKRELDGLVQRVKSVKLSAGTRRLMELCDDSEQDVRRYALRSPALEATPLQDHHQVSSAAEAVERYLDITEQHRRTSYGFKLSGD